jgi:chemotaxis protein CheX
MAVDLYKPFLEATRSVFQLMLDLSDVSDCPVENFTREDALSVAVGVTGDLTGEVFYHFPRVTSINMVAIMSGMEVDSVDDFVTSAVAEIANIISGNVLTLLSGDDLICDILPPELREIGDSREGAPHTASLLTTSLGEVYLDIRLDPNK